MLVQLPQFAVGRQVWRNLQRLRSSSGPGTRGQTEEVSRTSIVWNAARRRTVACVCGVWWWWCVGGRGRGGSRRRAAARPTDRALLKLWQTSKRYALGQHVAYCECQTKQRERHAGTHTQRTCSRQAQCCSIASRLDFYRAELNSDPLQAAGNFKIHSAHLLGRSGASHSPLALAQLIAAASSRLCICRRVPPLNTHRCNTAVLARRGGRKNPCVGFRASSAAASRARPCRSSQTHPASIQRVGSPLRAGAKEAAANGVATRLLVLSGKHAVPAKVARPTCRGEGHAQGRADEGPCRCESTHIPGKT